MHLIFDNVNQAFPALVTALQCGDIPTRLTSSRNGDAMVIDEPVIITYNNPRERVLFNTARDCNPFFHLFESLWMLAGRADISPLTYYAKQIGEYSDDGTYLNGAYGYRWRKQEVRAYCDPDHEYVNVDQLPILIKHLKEKPDSRRAVLIMWDVEHDLMRIDNQHQEFSKDVCCNLSVEFLLRPASAEEVAAGVHREGYLLDMTVFNRSNDLIWGSMGANVVHFSFLQEYMANCIGVGMGVYNQISNNLHTYMNNWEPNLWLEAPRQDFYTGIPAEGYVDLVKDQAAFDFEVEYFVNNHCNMNTVEVAYTEPFLQTVAMPMCMAFAKHKQRNYDEAFKYIRQVKSHDWAVAGEAWLRRRMEKWAAKQEKKVTS